MPKLSEIAYERHGFMKLPRIPWFAEAANHEGIAHGGVYLLSGPPGGGKTTLALQIAVDLASCGRKVLYLSLEQSPSDIKHKVEKQIFPRRRRDAGAGPVTSNSMHDGVVAAKRLQRSGSDEARIEENFSIDDSVSSMEALPDFLARQVLGGSSPHSDAALIIVDSIQGLGTAPTSSKPYQRLFDFNRWAKEDGIAVILVGHVTKGGAIAGPRSLEHNVDCVLYLRKAMRLRPLFVPKNRFGPERHEPLTLVMDDLGCLEKSKHVRARASQTFGLLDGGPGGIVEVQALVKLPKYGDKPGIKAPYLPRQKLSQLIGIVSSLHEIDISDLTFEVNCALPGGRQYRETLDLPLAMSMLSSYFQRQIPEGTLFAGELDLFQNVRPLSSGWRGALADALSPDPDRPLAHCVRRVYVSGECADEVRLALGESRPEVDVHGLATLEDAVKAMWPDAVEP